MQIVPPPDFVILQNFAHQKVGSKFFLQTFAFYTRIIKQDILQILLKQLAYYSLIDTIA